RAIPPLPAPRRRAAPPLHSPARNPHLPSLPTTPPICSSASALSRRAARPDPFYCSFLPPSARPSLAMAVRSGGGARWASSQYGAKCGGRCARGGGLGEQRRRAWTRRAAERLRRARPRRIRLRRARPRRIQLRRARPLEPPRGQRRRAALDQRCRPPAPPDPLPAPPPATLPSKSNMMWEACLLMMRSYNMTNIGAGGNRKQDRNRKLDWDTKDS
ncbi:unnamed protein product, partial [Urochloa humidicola]